MRQLLYIIIIIALSACKAHYDEDIEVCKYLVMLTYPENIEGSKEGIRVELKSIGHDAVFVDSTDAEGVATFTVTPGIYEASASTILRPSTNTVIILNGSSGQVVLNKDASTTIQMRGSKVNQLVIKELYVGGITKDDGKAFHFDKSFILYNNSSATATFDQLCIGIVAPYNSQATNRWYGSDGRLIYEADGYIPVIDGIWYFPQTLLIEPYERVVVNTHGAIDNTLTYPQSVNYAHADYYCMYDPEVGYTNPSYYPTPADVIPTSHYLKAVKIGISNAWALSTSSPALILFQVKGTTPQVYASNVENMMYIPGTAQNDINKCLKVPVDWVMDAVEVFSATSANSNMKRLTPVIDAGYVNLTNQRGHSLYRNVDKDATESLPENAGKLVYGYSLCVDGSSEPSGIDAEASIKNGAHIVYQDTNNSSNDFHERQKCSLRDSY